MPLTKRMTTVLEDVTTRFEYKPDGKIDTWTVNRHEKGTIQGDCEDFSLSVLWGLSERSWVWFFWYILTFQAVMWHVTSYNGNGHAALWFRGRWCDNMVPEWYETSDMPHTRRFPHILPTVLIKLLIGKLFG